MGDTILANAQEAVAEWEEVADNLAEALEALRRRRRNSDANDAWQGAAENQTYGRDYYRAPYIPPWAISLLPGGYSPPPGDEGGD